MAELSYGEYVGKWEKISKLTEWKAFAQVNYCCLVTMFKQQRSPTISNPVIHSDQKRLIPLVGGGGEVGAVGGVRGVLLKISNSWEKRKPISC